MQDKKQTTANEHSTACLYGYALARLGLTDTPQMRVLFWDAQEALEWDEKTDRYVTPSAEGECSQCGHIQEPAHVKTNEVTPIVVPDDMPSTEANTKYGESYGVDWVYAGKKEAPAAVAVPDAVRDAEMLLRAEAARLDRIYGAGKWYGFSAEKASHLEHLRVADALAATPAADAPAQTIERQRMTAGRASFFMERFLREEKLLGPNEQAALHFVIDMLEAAAAPVVLPDDAEIIAALEAAGVEFLKFRGGLDGKTLVHTTSGSQKASSVIAGCRALLATATGLPAQAVDGPPIAYAMRWPDQRPDEKPTILWPEQVAAHGADMRAKGQMLTPIYEHPQAQADAREAQLLAFAVSEIRSDEMTDSALLDAMDQNRIAVVPEYEGPWDAEVYNDEGKPNHRGSGSTPREAIRAAIAAAKGE